MTHVTHSLIPTSSLPIQGLLYQSKITPSTDASSLPPPRPPPPPRLPLAFPSPPPPPHQRHSSTHPPSTRVQPRPERPLTRLPEPATLAAMLSAATALVGLFWGKYRDTYGGCRAILAYLSSEKRRRKSKMGCENEASRSEAGVVRVSG